MHAVNSIFSKARSTQGFRISFSITWLLKLLYRLVKEKKQTNKRRVHCLKMTVSR